MYFSTHPGTLKTVHGNPLNFPSKTTCSQGGVPQNFRSPPLKISTHLQIWTHMYMYIHRCQILGTVKIVKKILKKIYRDQNIVTFLFLRVRSSSLESDQTCAETFISEHFQTLFRKSDRSGGHQNHR